MLRMPLWCNSFQLSQQDQEKIHLVEDHIQALKAIEPKIAALRDRLKQAVKSHEQNAEHYQQYLYNDSLRVQGNSHIVKLSLKYAQARKGRNFRTPAHFAIPIILSLAFAYLVAGNAIDEKNNAQVSSFPLVLLFALLSTGLISVHIAFNSVYYTEKGVIKDGEKKGYCLWFNQDFQNDLLQMIIVTNSLTFSELDDQLSIKPQNNFIVNSAGQAPRGLLNKPHNYFENDLYKLFGKAQAKINAEVIFYNKVKANIYLPSSRRIDDFDEAIQRLNQVEGQPSHQQRQEPRGFRLGDAN